MSKEYIITMTATNRVGVMSAITTAMAELDADLRAMEQSVVRQFFTMILAAEFPDHRDPQVILDHLRDAGRPYGIEVQLNDPQQSSLPGEPDENATLLGLSLAGKNARGVLRQVAARIALYDSDIRNLRANRSNDEQSFEMMLVVAVSPQIDPQRVIESLVEVGDQLGFAVSVLSLDPE